MMQNVRATAFTFSELLKESQHLGRGGVGGWVDGKITKLRLGLKCFYVMQFKHFQDSLNLSDVQKFGVIIRA